MYPLYILLVLYFHYCYSYCKINQIIFTVGLFVKKKHVIYNQFPFSLNIDIIRIKFYVKMLLFITTIHFYSTRIVSIPTNYIQSLISIKMLNMYSFSNLYSKLITKNVYYHDLYVIKSSN